MLFNSLTFLLFAAVFFAGWPILRRRNNTRWAYLTIASFVFYGWWDWRFLALIIFSGMIDYLAGLGMARWPRAKKLLLGLSLLGNLGSLGLFKYADFLVGNVNALGGLLGTDWNLPGMNLILPVGISFYTFQSMSYTIDIYRGQLKPTRNVLHFFAYLAMFPQLVAGPIVRAAELIPQLKTYRKTTEHQRWSGLQLIAGGMFKKVVVADAVAQYVEVAFSAGAVEASAVYWWVIMVLYAFQIYCDFSGYSDIARGLARWMGYEFPVNFNHPYLAGSFRDFWGRWHISLSTWFRDYVYVPLGGSKRGHGRGHLNMWVTMLVSGLWHGANWTFVVWGGLHAGYLSLERATRWPDRLGKLPGGRHLCTLTVFALTLVAWVFFRAESFTQAGTIVATMFNPTQLGLGALREQVHVWALYVVAVMIARHLWLYFDLDHRRPMLLGRRWLEPLRPAAVAAVLVACIYLRGPGAAFIYFQF